MDNLATNKAWPTPNWRIAICLMLTVTSITLWFRLIVFNLHCVPLAYDLSLAVQSIGQHIGKQYPHSNGPLSRQR